MNTKDNESVDIWSCHSGKGGVDILAGGRVRYEKSRTELQKGSGLRRC